ncbi:MAG TPA: murein biosynthesis integral membrane protein MurJ [Galbitalea sp.]|nr:murein biosynthesis integral membrane protein MurJ [Galbitalea sp.]
MTGELPPDVAPDAASGIGRASAILASGTLVSRLLGFVSAAVLAYTLGTIGVAANTFRIANQLPNNIYAIIAGGLLSAILVPQIVRASKDTDGGEKFVNRLVTLGIVAFLAIAVAATLLAGPLVHLYASQATNGSGRGLSAADFQLATAFAYWCLPQILFYALYSLLGEVLNARRVFGPFTWAPVVNNLVAIAGLVAFNLLFAGSTQADAWHWTPGMVTLLAGSATLGVVGQAFFLVLFWRRTGLHFRPEFRWRGVGLGKIGRAAFWTFSMILITQLAGIVQSRIATLAGKHNPSNAVLWYAWLIFMLPHGIITISIATPYFTRMSGHAHRGDFDALRSDLGAALRTIGVLLTFASVALIAVANPFSAVFSQTTAQSGAMAAVLIAYLVGLLPFSIVFVLQRTFYSLEDTRTPFLFQTFQSVLLVAGMLFAGTLGAPVIALGIAIATTLADIALVIVAAVLLSRRMHGLGAAALFRSYFRFAVAVVPAAAAGVGLDYLFGSFDGGFAESGRFAALLCVAVIGAGMALVYAGMLAVLRVPEFAALTAPLRRRLRRAA